MKNIFAIILMVLMLAGTVQAGDYIETSGASTAEMDKETPTTAGIIIDEASNKLVSEADKSAAAEQIKQKAVINPVIDQKLQNDKAKRLR